MIHCNTLTLRCGLIAILLAGVGCTGSDAAAPLIPDPAKVYRKLELNHDAVMMTLNAPYDTVQLRAVPISLAGDTLQVDQPVIYYRMPLQDQSLQVDSFTGMVNARITTNTGRVVARMVVGQDTFLDTVQIMVRNDATFRRVTRIEIFPLAPDSAWRWAGTRQNPPYDNWVRLYDDATIPTLIQPTQRLVSTRVQNAAVVGGVDEPNSAEYATPTARALVGESYIYARVYAYGQEFRDSMLFRRVDPPVRLVMIDRVVPRDGAPTIAFFPAVTRARVGTTVVFLNMFGGSSISGSDGDIFPFLPCEDGTSSYCGNRIRNSEILPSYVNSEIVWVDSVDINFDRPDLVSAGQEFTGNTQFNFKNSPLPTDGGTGNIPAFSVVYCKGFMMPNNGCGTGVDIPGFAIGGWGTMNIDNGMRSRRFMTAGTYQYSSTRFPGATGTIIITE